MQPDGQTPAAFELRFQEVEIRAAADADGKPVRRVEGVATPWSSKTKIRSWGGYDFEEWFEPDAFGETLRSGADVRLLLEHDSRALLARTKAGNLKLTSTARGLEFAAELPDTQLARDAIENIRAKNYAGMSFGFRPVESQRSYDGKGRLVSIAHRNAALLEVSVVSNPAYARTSVALRSLLSSAPPGPSAETLALRARLARRRG